MRDEERSEILRELSRHELAAKSLREKLRISPPGSVMYRACFSICNDDEVVVETDGHGGAITSVVEGNYPIDYITKYERGFESEHEASAIADAIVTGVAEVSDVLRNLNSI